MARFIKMFSIIVVLLFLSSVTQAETLGKETLKGLKGVHVLVETLSPDIEKDGLRKSSLHTDVELKLRLAGIKVLTKEEYLKEPGKPYLYVNVGSLKDERGFYHFSIEVALNQVVTLLRDFTITSFAITWRATGRFGYAGEERVESFIRSNINDSINEFINDYLAMNPKEKKE